MSAKVVDDLIAYCRENNRVCPQPQQWDALWQMLPNRGPRGAIWEPPPPLILAAWHDTPAMLKMLRLAEHIKWAATHNSLQAVSNFLRNLSEDEWHHVGE